METLLTVIALWPLLLISFLTATFLILCFIMWESRTTYLLDKYREKLFWPINK